MSAESLSWRLRFCRVCSTSRAKTISDITRAAPRRPRCPLQRLLRCAMVVAGVMKVGGLEPPRLRPHRRRAVVETTMPPRTLSCTTTAISTLARRALTTLLGPGRHTARARRSAMMRTIHRQSRPVRHGRPPLGPIQPPTPGLWADLSGPTLYIPARAVAPVRPMGSGEKSLRASSGRKQQNHGCGVRGPVGGIVTPGARK